MRKLISTLTAAAGSASLLLANASGVLAQWDDDFTYDYGYDTVDTGAAAGMTAVSWAITCCCSIFGLAMFAFSIWMLVHAIQHAPEDQRILWILIILLVPFGSVIYFFVKKKEFDGGSKSSGPAETKEG